MILTKDTYNLYAAHGYRNPCCISEDEFYKDLARVSKIKMQLNRHGLGTSNYLLLINNVIAFYNVFEYKTANNLILFKLEQEQYKYLFAVLDVLNIPSRNDIVGDFDIDEEFKLKIIEELYETI